jgi:predicted nicotinamide N-methyase
MQKTASSPAPPPRDHIFTVRYPAVIFTPADVEVLDLPQLYAKPSARRLIETLSSLKLSMPSWDVDQASRKSATSPNVSLDSRALSTYLTCIIASSLKWIEGDELREEIWEKASARLSERSGRSGMSALDRSFQIPSPAGTIELAIHEPALTADNLGLKTWAASYLLAKRLLTLDLPDELRIGDRYALELGSGTGLVGMAAAAVLGAHACLTDLPEIKPNLERNIRANLGVITSNNGIAISGVLDWTEPQEILFDADGPEELSMAKQMQNRSDFPLILAADSIYAADHPRKLAETMKRWLSKTPWARIVVELPLRPRSEAEIESFRKCMEGNGFALLKEEEDVGYDDWQSSSSDRLLVNCWFSVWAWS